MPPAMFADELISPDDHKQGNPPYDQELLRRVGKGDDTALRTLMDRHDALVRYTIFRTARRQALRDPQWLDAVAGETWQGLVHSARRSAVVESVSLAPYLTGIARRQAITALRRLSAFARHEATGGHVEALAQAEQTALDPLVVASDLESLTVLRQCVAELDDADKLLMTQLPAITQRKWVEAGAVLGMSESTLRSKWAKVLDRLRICMERRTEQGRATR